MSKASAGKLPLQSAGKLMGGSITAPGGAIFDLPEAVANKVREEVSQSALSAGGEIY